MLAEKTTQELGDNYVVLRSKVPSDNRIGIYARGSCHLRAVFACAPLIQQVLRGSCGILYEGVAAMTRSDLTLQTLRDLPREWTEPVIQRCHLQPDYFEPRLFHDTFRVWGDEGEEEFPKKVVLLHISPDSAGRTLYRHRQHGFLVDPGGGWLTKLDAVLGDLDSIRWFRENFESIGLIRVEEFVENYTQIIRLLRERMDAHLLIFTTLGVEPGTLTHNYQLVKNPQSMRWREFNIALMELSRKLDFTVVDMDRILKCAGIRTQVEFAHFLPRQNLFVAREIFRVLKRRGVFDS